MRITVAVFSWIFILVTAAKDKTVMLLPWFVHLSSVELRFHFCENFGRDKPWNKKQLVILYLG